MADEEDEDRLEQLSFFPSTFPPLPAVPVAGVPALPFVPGIPLLAPSDFKSISSPGEARLVESAYAAAPAAAIPAFRPEPIAQSAARAAEDTRLTLEQRRAEDDKLMRAFFPSIQAFWKLHNRGTQLRGKRTKVVPDQSNTGLPYEIALHAMSSNSALEGEDIKRVTQRAEKLGEDPSSALWSNELAILTTALRIRKQQTPLFVAQTPVPAAAAPRPAVPLPEVEEIRPPEDLKGDHVGDLTFRKGHWWSWSKPLNENGRWVLTDPDKTKYGDDPIKAMQKYIKSLIEAWQNTRPEGEKVDEEKKWRVGDTERRWVGFYIVWRKGRGLQPRNAELRRVFGLGELDARVFTEQELDVIRAALKRKTKQTLGSEAKSTREKKTEHRVLKADDIYKGWRSSLQGKEINALTIGRPEVVWSGSQWQPMNLTLRKQLGFSEKLSELLL